MIEEQVFGFGDVAKVLLLGAMPWLNYLKPLRWHLRASNFNPVPIFNSVATICAALLSYLYYESSDPLELFVPPLWWLLPLFILPAVLYFALFLIYREPVAAGKKRWPLMVAFLVYIALFCSLAVVAGNLEIRRVFKIVRGGVVDAQRGVPVEGARVDFAAESEPVAYDFTAADGSFRVAVKRSTEVDELLVNKQGFKEYSAQIHGGLKASYPNLELEREALEDTEAFP